MVWGMPYARFLEFGRETCIDRKHATCIIHAESKDYFIGVELTMLKGINV